MNFNGYSKPMTEIHELIELPGGCTIRRGRVARQLIPDKIQFETLWNFHPNEHSEITIHGKKVKVPRWDRAYEKDYPFSNSVAEAHVAPVSLIAFLEWCRSEIDERVNGLFVNWHDGKQSHYHGKHRDSVKGLIHGTPIVTVSLGEERVFRMRPYPEGKPPLDYTLESGDFIVIPWETNQKWTHEVPKFAKYQGRRISVTMRAFE